MSELFAITFMLIGMVFAFAGKSIIEVAACFIVFGICHGAYELHLLRKELEDDEE